MLIEISPTKPQNYFEFQFPSVCRDLAYDAVWSLLARTLGFQNTINKSNSIYSTYNYRFVVHGVSRSVRIVAQLFKGKPFSQATL